MATFGMVVPKLARATLTRKTDAWLVWLIGLGALVLYWATAAPGITALYDDSLEFQLAAPTFAIAHPTGYPLYTLLGGLWSRVIFPFGNWACRMNLFSALAGGVTVALIYLLAKRLSGGNLFAGLTAAIAFALGPVWWSQTTIAEVYALHNLFVAALLYTAVSLGQKPSPRQMIFLCGLAGLSLSHHRTAILLLPGLALYLLWTQPALRRLHMGWLVWACAFLAPLLLYLYIPLRSAAGAVDLQGEYINTWSGFWRHVLASGYTGFFADNSLAATRPWSDWLALVVAQFGWPLLGLAIIGLMAGVVGRGVGSARRADWGLVWLMLGANALFAVNYRVADAEVFWLPVFLCVALGVGNGAGWLAGLISDKSVWPRRTSALLLLALVMAGTVTGVGGRGALVNRSGDWDAHTYALSLARVDFPADSRVVGLRGQMTALRLMQASQGMASSALPIALDDPTERRDFIEESMVAGLPVYLTQEVAGIEDDYSFSGDGVLVRVWPRGQAQPGTPTHPLALSLSDDALQVVGYSLEKLDQPGEPTLRATLYWQPLVQIPQRLKLSLRLLDNAENPVQTEDRYPLRQVASTTAWLPGEIVQDVHDMPLPSTAVELLVIVYDEATVAEVGRFTLPLP